jgi:hypothetical protein
MEIQSENTLKGKKMLTNEQRNSLLESRPERTVTKQQIESRIKNTEYRIHANSTLTICVLTMENGFTVVGKSACAHPGNFNKELGEKIAYDDAFEQIWVLEGYLLREALYLEGVKSERQ